MIIVDHPFDTRWEAEAFRDRYLQNWDPDGYGTTLRITPVLPDCTWRVSGWRSGSCD